LSIKRIALLSVGAVFLLLGILWFLQGVGLVHMQPILCFANCEPITGPQLLWTMIGLVAIGIGFLMVRAGRSAPTNR
jgi:hypothetical protein